MKKCFTGLFAAVLSLGLVSGAFAAEPANLNIVGATLGGAVNAGYAAFAQFFMKAHPGCNVNIMPGGAVSNPTRIFKKVGEISHTQGVVLKASVAGAEPYKTPHTGLKSMFRLGDEARLHFIARDDVPFTSLEEIRDKKIPIVLATSPKGTTNELYGRWVLEAVGITYDDIKSWGGQINNSAYATVVDMMKNKQVDMVMWVGPGVPVFMQEVALSQKLRWIPVSPELADKIEKTRGLKKSVIKAEEFNGLIGVDTPCVTDYTEVFTRADVSEELIYTITKVWMEHHEAIREACKGWKDNAPAQVWQGVSLPLHPGAEKYFREIGVMK